MNSLDIALQNIQAWSWLAQVNNVKQSYKLWRENGVWLACVNTSSAIIVEN